MGVSGGARPRAYGTQTVCAYLVDSYRQFADNTVAPLTVNVSRACTAAADHYDRLRRHHARLTNVSNSVRSTTAWNASGRPGQASFGRSGRADRTRSTVSAGVAPSHGGLPVSRAYATAPRQY